MGREFDFIFDYFRDRIKFDSTIEFKDGEWALNPSVRSLVEIAENKFQLHGKGAVLSEVRFVKSNNATLAIAKEKMQGLPYVPHIEGYRYKKVMVYINDVTLESGPIHLLDENPEIFEKQRLGLS